MVNSYHPLTGILKCNKCGSNMVLQKRRSKNNTYRYYVCSTYLKKGREHCSQKNINANELEKSIVNLLENKILTIKNNSSFWDHFITNNKNLIEIARIELELINRQIFKVQNELNMLQEQKREIENKINRLYNEHSPEVVRKYVDEFVNIDKNDIYEIKRYFHFFIDFISIDDENVVEIKFTVE